MRGKGEGAVYKAANGLWTVALELPSPDGSRRRKVIRSKDKRTVLAKLAEAKRELAERGDLPTASQTAESWFRYWIDEVVPKFARPKTAGGYRSVVNNHIIPALGSVKLDKLTAAHVRRVHDAIIDKGLSPTYALNAHRVMSTSLEMAYREGRIGRNPAKMTKAPRKARPDLDVLTLEEGLQLLEHVSHDPQLGARWATSLLTGGRRGEVIGLEVDRVTDDVLDLSWQLQRFSVGQRTATGAPGRPDVPPDFEYRHLIDGLYLTRPKSNAGWRVIPMFEPLRSILSRHIASMEPNEWGLLFTWNGRPIDPDYDSRRWRDVLAETGINKNVRLHDLRHTTVDLLYLAGVPEDLIVEIVGHSTRAMSRSYKSRGNITRLRGAMEQFETLFKPLGDGRSETPGAAAS